LKEENLDVYNKKYKDFLSTTIFISFLFFSLQNLSNMAWVPVITSVADAVLKFFSGGMF
jgi:pilus assembly protein TadC